MHQALDVLHRASALCAKQAKEWEALKAEFEKAGNEESPKPKSKATSPKPKPTPKPAVVKESDSDDDSDDVPPAKPKAKAAAAAPKPAADDSDSDDDSDVPPPKPKAAAKPKPQAAQDSDDSDDDSDIPAAKPKPQAKAAAKPKAPAVADSDDSDDSDDDVPAAKPKPAAKAAAKPADDDSDEDSDAPAPKPKAAPKRKAAENGAEPAAKVQKLETTELMMLNIPESMTDDDIWNHYKSLGDEAITRINRPSNQTMCFVTFQSAELAAKGLAMDPPEKDGTWVTVKPAVPKGKGKGKGGKGDGEVFDVMIRNCADGITDDVVKKHYKKIADSIQHIRWVTDRETGAFRGFGFIKFTTKEAADTAVEMGGPVYEEQETTVAHAAGKGEKGGKGKGGKGDKGGKGGKGKGKGGRGPSMKPEGEKVTFDD